MNYLILLGAMIVLFYKAFYCGYVVDDVHMRTVFTCWKKAWHRGWREKYKLITNFFYSGGIFQNAQQEYAFTLSVHYINCCLIYHMSGSLFGALLYLVNPINNQTSLWMNGRRYALSILAVLLAWNWKILAIVLFPFCACISISAIVAPLLLIWTKYWPLIPLLGGIVTIIFNRNLLMTFKKRKSEFKDGNENHNITWRKLILYVKSVGYNFVNCILPFKPAMYHNFLFYFSNSIKDNEAGYSINMEFFKGIAVLSFLGFMIIVQHNFWAFWFLLFISPWCNLYQVTMNASDRYCSLANVGAMLMLAGIINQLPEIYRLPIFIGFIVLYFLKYQPLFRAYISVENFYLYHLNLQPDLVNPRYYLARYYLEHHDIYSAFSVIQKGLKYRPFDFRFLLCMMEVLFQLGQIEAALKVMSVAERHVPMLEVKDCKVFFDGLRERFKKDIEIIEKQKFFRSKNVHNNGHPIMSKK